MEPEGSSPHSQAPATCPYPDPAQSTDTHLEYVIFIAFPLPKRLREHTLMPVLYRCFVKNICHAEFLLHKPISFVLTFRYIFYLKIQNQLNYEEISYGFQTLSWVMTPCVLTDCYRRFEDTLPLYVLHLKTEAGWEISDFRRELHENCDLLGYYAASSGNFLPLFRDNLSVPSSGITNFFPLKMWPDMLTRNVGKKLQLLAA